MLSENLQFDFASSFTSTKNPLIDRADPILSRGDIPLNPTSPASPFVLPENLATRSRLIHENAVFQAQEYLTAEAALLEALIEVDRYEIYRELGYAYLTPYCEKHLGLSADVAAVFVRVARKSREIPNLQIAVQEGLSVTKAKTIVSVLNQNNQNDWIQKAKILSKEKLEKEIARIHPKLSQPERAQPIREDRTRLEFELSDQTLSLQRRAQDLVSRKIGKSASLEETQEKLLEFFLFHHDPLQKAQRADRRKTKVARKIPDPLGKKSQARSRDRSAESPSQARVSAPARARIPNSVLHAVHRRDHGCCQEKLPDGSLCLQKRWVEIHHLVPQSHGGPDTVENLVTLCSAHHRLRHRIPREPQVT